MAYQKTACLPIPFIAKSPGVLYGNGLLQDTKQYSQWFYFPAIEISSKAMISNLNYPLSSHKISNTIQASNCISE